MKLESKFNKFAQEGGFTLIEMLIVVAIIGILVAIAVPALNTAKSDAQNAKIKAVQSSLALAKNRAFLKGNFATGEAVTLDATTNPFNIQPYLLINGTVVNSANPQDILAGTGLTAASNTIGAVLSAVSMSTDFTGL